MASEEVVVHLLPVSNIEPDPGQPRQYFEAEGIDELARSLTAVGQIQAIIVRPHPGKPGKYLIVAGERRYRAAKKAGLKYLKAEIRHLSADEVAAVQLAENEARRETLIMEPARFIVAQLLAGVDLETLAARVGKPVSWIHGRAALAKLTPSLQRLVDEKRIPVSVAVALGEMPPEIQRDVWEAAALHSKTASGQLQYVSNVQLKSAGRDIFGSEMLAAVSGLSPRQRRALANKIDRALHACGKLASYRERDVAAYPDAAGKEFGPVLESLKLTAAGIRKTIKAVEKVAAARAVSKCSLGVCKKLPPKVEAALKPTGEPKPSKKRARMPRNRDGGSAPTRNTRAKPKKTAKRKTRNRRR